MESACGKGLLLPSQSHALPTTMVPGWTDDTILASNEPRRLRARERIASSRLLLASQADPRSGGGVVDRTGRSRGHLVSSPLILESRTLPRRTRGLRVSSADTGNRWLWRFAERVCPSRVVARSCVRDFGRGRRAVLRRIPSTTFDWRLSLSSGTLPFSCRCD